MITSSNFSKYFLVFATDFLSLSRWQRIRSSPIDKLVEDVQCVIGDDFLDTELFVCELILILANKSSMFLNFKHQLVSVNDNNECRFVFKKSEIFTLRKRAEKNHNLCLNRQRCDSLMPFRMFSSVWKEEEILRSLSKKERCVESRMWSFSFKNIFCLATSCILMPNSAKWHEFSAENLKKRINVYRLFLFCSSSSFLPCMTIFRAHLYQLFLQLGVLQSQGVQLLLEAFEGSCLRRSGERHLWGVGSRHETKNLQKNFIFYSLTLQFIAKCTECFVNVVYTVYLMERIR